MAYTGTNHLGRSKCFGFTFQDLCGTLGLHVISQLMFHLQKDINKHVGSLEILTLERSILYMHYISLFIIFTLYLNFKL